ncbi:MULTISPECIES: beta-N-acetylglucosaminidase domain-containing protein [unclassified Carboxylicivirga]|uniref:beta-N-acetylglucosaminidase domain-containing protein n=1 Tax=Carboxylicivirga TaxID=1628153 RepID=UPI003D34370D
MIQKFFLRTCYALCLSLFLVGSVKASEHQAVYPTPQKVKGQGDEFVVAKGAAKWKIGKGVDANTVTLLKSLLDGLQVNVVAGTADDKKMGGYDIPEAAEGYYLKVSPKKIVLAGRDARGVFYAGQTLRQLMNQGGDEVRMPSLEVQDWPDVVYRGTVEGFYGKPWSHTNRLSQLRFYGEYKLNTYIYGPKDDPYHGFSDQWREPYPSEKALEIKELVDVARANHVNYVWAVHPGRDIHWNDSDGDGIIDDFVACKNKFELMYDLGVRSFAVFFDDISGEGTDARRQAEMLNYLNANFIRQKPDVTSLIMCPTQYNRAWSGGDYLDILGNELDKDIDIMWTGNSVCADITRESMDWINARIKRKAFIWWNWPVSDYVRTRLLLGRTYGLDVDNKGTLSGFASNPMDKPEASKIGLFGVADYTWNMKGFESEASWKAGIQRLFPTLAEPMLCFASHNSDQGLNTHGYRREESVAIRPAMEAFQKAYLEDGNIDPKAYMAIVKAFDEMAQAGKTLREELPTVNPAFYEETRFWIASFEALGQAGQKLMAALIDQDLTPKARLEAINHTLSQLYQMDDFSRQQKKSGEPDPWAKGCETAATVVTPFVKTLLNHEAAAFYTAVSGKERSANDAAADYYRVFTNVDALQAAQVTREGKYVRINPMLEVIGLQPGKYVGITLPEGIFANYVHLRLGNDQVAAQGVVEVSGDGQSWKAIKTTNKEDNMQARLSVKDQVRYARLRNTSDSKLEIKIDLFKLDVPGEARVNAPAMMYDGDMDTYFAYQEDEPLVITCPEQSSAHFVYIMGDFEGATVHFTDGSKVAYSKLSNTNDKTIAKISFESVGSTMYIHEVIWGK